MRKKLLAILLALALTVTATVGMGVTASAATGSGTSTYYYNLAKETANTFSVGNVIYLTESNTSVENKDYISYSWPSVLSAKVQVTSGMSVGSHYCTGTASQNAKHYTVKVLQKAPSFDGCQEGCIYQVSGNQWAYSCHYGGVRNQTVYLYKCQSGTFSAADVTFDWNSDGSIAGAKIFAGTADQVQVPASMLQITDNTVNPANGDFSRTAVLGDVTAVAVDGMLAYEPYIAPLASHSNAQKEAIKEALKNAVTDAEVKKIISDANAADAAHKAAQQQALADAQAAAEAAKARIDAVNDGSLSEQEKAELKTAVDHAAAAAATAINGANIDNLAQVKSDALAKIALYADMAEAISKAVKDAEDAKARIEKLTDLSQAEKQAKLDAINNRYMPAAKKLIVQQANKAEVDELAKNIADTYDAIANQAEAMDAIDGAAKAEKAAINGMANLTPEEKQAKLAAVDAAVATAKNTINGLNLNQLEGIDGKIEAAKNSALSAIDLAGHQAAALDALHGAAGKAVAAIQAMEDLTPAEKTAKLTAVTAAETAAVSAVEAAADTAAVKTAKDSGVAAIELAQAKAAAMDQIHKAAGEATAAFDAMKNLTPEEKEEAVKAVAAAEKTAIEEIEAAQTLAAVTAAETKGKEEIAKIRAQAAGKDATRQLAADAKAEIAKLKNLTPEEMQAKLDAVDAAAAEAEKNINTAADAAAAQAAANAGNTAIGLIGKKAAAMDKIHGATAAAEAAINAMTDLTPQEKDAKLAQLAAADAAAIDAINAAGNTAAVEKAEAEGLAAIGLVQEKADAMQEIAKAAKDTKAAIDGLKNLTPEEKQAKKDAVDAAAAKAKDAVDTAKTMADAEKAEADGLTAIALEGRKAALKDALIKDTEDKKAEITAMKNLTAEQKAAFITQISDNLDAALAAIDAAADEKAAQAAAVKAAAIHAVKAAEAKALDTVAAQKKLTAEEKKAYTDAISAKAAKAIADIKAADAAAENLAATVNGIAEDAVTAMNGSADEAIAQNFVKAYVTGQDGTIYTEATAKNYKQIVSGKSSWNKMTQAQKDLVNSRLTANGSKTYEELLERAEELKKVLSPQTGDTRKLALWMTLCVMGCLGVAATAVYGKKKKLF